MPAIGPCGGVVLEENDVLRNPEALVATNLFEVGLSTVNPLQSSFLKHTGKGPNLGNLYALQ